MPKKKAASNPDRRTPFRTLSLAAQVQRVTPSAKDMVLLGLPLEPATDALDRVPMNVLEPILGHDGPNTETDSEAVQIGKLDDVACAAFALGIAVGHLVSPAVFAKGGAR